MSKFEEGDNVIVNYGGTYNGHSGTVVADLGIYRDGIQRYKIRISPEHAKDSKSKHRYMNRKPNELSPITSDKLEYLPDAPEVTDIRQAQEEFSKVDRAEANTPKKRGFWSRLFGW